MIMNYEEMSDFEINKAVARYESLVINESQSLSKNPSGVMVNDIVSGFTFDPCNNPSDAWPIILESKFKLDPRRSSPKLDWMVSLDDQIYSVDKNPLRAAMICFLKMKDAECKS